MSKYLLEIGTEELPAGFCYSVINQLQTLAKYELEKNSIKYENIFCSSTPRRIVLLISGLIDYGEDKIELRKGPKAEVAFINGEPAAAAIGFARSLDISVEDLKIKKTEKGVFVFGEKIDKGKSAKILISSLVPKIIKSIQGQRFMKWGYGQFKFSRPLRWIISLYNNDILGFEIENINLEFLLGRTSRGHRLVKENIEINNPDDYFPKIEKSGVLIKRDFRKKCINDLIKEKSDELKLHPDLPSNLLNELTDLVEFPDLVLGGFDSRYLSLPAEVLCTVMKNHQRYIPLLKTNKNISKLKISSEDILSTKFICISNGLNESNQSIKEGNENVLKARFADAKFFVEEDKKISCIQRNLKINNISYLKGLGSVAERVNRIVFLSSQIFEILNDSTLNLEKVLEASQFSKHDLCSEIVNEFPELQGLMGGKYLKNEGYSDDVSLAVCEHYLPRFNDDILPSTKYGAITSLSDKFETLISLFVIGKRASGSSDPYALRRNLNGIIQIIWHYEFDLQLDTFVLNLLKYWDEVLNDFAFDNTKVRVELFEFIRQRIKSFLEEQNYEKELINSLCESEYIQESRIFNIKDLKKRIKVLCEIKLRKNSDAFISIISRISKLAKNGTLKQDVFKKENIIDSSLFEKEAELKVFDFIGIVEELISKKNWTYQELISLFDKNLELLENIFDTDKGVLIMSEDSNLRENRLNLLGLVRNYSLLISDFTILNL